MYTRRYSLPRKLVLLQLIFERFYPEDFWPKPFDIMVMRKVINDKSMSNVRQFFFFFFLKDIFQLVENLFQENFLNNICNEIQKKMFFSFFSKIDKKSNDVAFF